jgi:hypothetical protein
MMFDSFKGKTLAQMKIRANQLAMENERLREALKPFAEFAEAITPDTPDKEKTCIYLESCGMWNSGQFGTVGDLRRASAVLGSGGNG